MWSLQLKTINLRLSTVSRLDAGCIRPWGYIAKCSVLLSFSSKYSKVSSDPTPLHTGFPHKGKFQGLRSPSLSVHNIDTFSNRQSVPHVPTDPSCNN